MLLMLVELHYFPTTMSKFHAIWRPFQMEQNGELEQTHSIGLFATTNLSKKKN